MFSLSTILIIVLTITAIIAVAYILRLSNRVRTLESKNSPASEIRESEFDESSVKE